MFWSFHYRLPSEPWRSIDQFKHGYTKPNFPFLLDWRQTSPNKSQNHSVLFPFLSKLLLTSLPIKPSLPEMAAANGPPERNPFDQNLCNSLNSFGSVIACLARRQQENKRDWLIKCHKYLVPHGNFSIYANLPSQWLRSGERLATIAGSPDFMGPP